MTEKLQLHISGMDCADCALHLEEALNRTPGVDQVSVDFALARLRVASKDGTEIRPSVEQVAKEMGYSLQPAGALDEESGASGWRACRALPTTCSGSYVTSIMPSASKATACDSAATMATASPT